MPTIKGKRVVKDYSGKVIDIIVKIEADDGTIHKIGVGQENLAKSKTELITLVKEKFLATQITEEVEELNIPF